MKAEEAAHRMLGKEGVERHERPGPIIVDLNHSAGEDRARLKQLVADLKGEPELRPIPVLLLMRENRMEDATGWYRAGVNACAVRPDSLADMIAFYRSTRAFWRVQVVLPDWEWP